MKISAIIATPRTAILKQNATNSINEKNTQQKVNQINSLSNYYYPLISFGAIQILNLNPKYRSQAKNIKKEIENFSQNPETEGKYLGSGIFADAYLLKNMPEIVIKKSYNNAETFKTEETKLYMLPDRLENIQKFVARAYDDKKNCFYLLTTKVDGKSPDPQTTPWTAKSLESIFNIMYELDTLGIYHGDLNNGNIKLTEDGQANLLDFQWATKKERFDYYKEKTDISQPDFMLVANAQMLEIAELPHYINKIKTQSEAKDFLKTYLKEKSKYHEKRAEFIKTKSMGKYTTTRAHSQKERAYKYEIANAQILKNPNTNILKLETKKIQFLNAFRQAYRKWDPNITDKNIIPTGTAYLYAMKVNSDFIKEVQKQINELYAKEAEKQKNHKGGPYFRDEKTQTLLDYLSFQKIYGDFWAMKFFSDSKNAFEFPLRHTSNRIETWETLHNFANPNVNINDFGKIPDITTQIDTNFEVKNSRNFKVQDTYINIYLNNINQNIENFEKLANDWKKTTIIKDSTEELKSILRQINEANENKRYLEVINLSLLAILKCTNIQKFMHQKRKLNKNYQYYPYIYNSQINNIQYSLKMLASNLFNSIREDLLKQKHNTDNEIGYENMNNLGQFKINY